MAEVEELHSRISAALQRISTAAEDLSNAPAAPEVAPVDAPVVEEAAESVPDTTSAELAAATQALEDEKTVTAQLEERMRALKARHAEELAEARSTSAGQSAAMAQVDVELQRLRQVIGQLRENNKALRDANAAGLADPHLINKSMMAELEALRAERAADVAEASAILSAMVPLLDDADAMEGV